MFTTDLQPAIRARFDRALALLQVSDRTRIGHIDCGVAAHPALGYSGATPPGYLRLDEGRDFLSANPSAPPVTDLVIGTGLKDRLTEIKASTDADRQKNAAYILEDWRKLTTSDHFYYMCTKYWADGDVHKYFSPYDSPYDAYINFMNVLDNMKHRVDD